MIIRAWFASVNPAFIHITWYYALLWNNE